MLKNTVEKTYKATDKQLNDLWFGLMGKMQHLDNEGRLPEEIKQDIEEIINKVMINVAPYHITRFYKKCLEKAIERQDEENIKYYQEQLKEV